ncbi:glycoside hydrolase family 28 protein [Bacteroides sp. 224]|uniref:glycoside hydrolase family 28 protein n=1 Tax=Bacteroides sp. 224 TaxID=2302936 RepID=UPI0013D456AD|nr:glycoside hydrolase family 28 protein [Bacteroides sp. 224]NDV65656.1 glycoside hydrolase family 28 protein [Bacteroides sp. 224]
MSLDFKGLIVWIAAIATLTGCTTQSSAEQIPSFSWIESDHKVDFSWVKDVGAKQFPEGNVFKANSFGAVNDSTHLSTKAIQEAIDACHEAGGGTVSFDPGYYVTGALFIKEGVNLEISEGATLLASTDIDDYPEFKSRVAGIEMMWPSAVLNVMDTKNAAISGKGQIDCRGKVFWDKYWEMRKEYETEGLRWIVDYDCKRVRGILISNSSNVSLKDFTLMRTGFWGIQVLYSQYCTVDGLKIDNNIGGHGPSTDGIDIDSSSYILVENCTIDCNDDNICLKAGRDADGLRVNRPTEYVVIRNCVAHKGGGLMTCGSETSGGIRNILAYNLKAYGTSTAMRLKSAMNRGGVIENIYMSNVIADDVKNLLVADLNWHPTYSYSKLPEKYIGQKIPEHWQVMLTPVEPKEKGYPHFKNVYMANVTATNVDQFISTSGKDETLQLENFGLYNMDIEAQKAGKIVFTENFTLKDIRLKTTENDQVELTNNSQLTAQILYK